MVWAAEAFADGPAKDPPAAAKVEKSAPSQQASTTAALAPQPEIDLASSRFVRKGVRKSEGTLAGDRSGTLSAPAQAAPVRMQQREDKIVPSRVPSAPKLVNATPKNGYNAAFDRLREHVASAAPHAKGRLSISFVVGRQGLPTEVSVMGLGGELDASLAALLAQQVLPIQDAGQFYSTRLTILPKARSVAEAPKKRARRARR